MQEQPLTQSIMNEFIAETKEKGIMPFNEFKDLYHKYFPQRQINIQTNQIKRKTIAV